MTRWEGVIIVLLFVLTTVYVLDLHQVSEIRNYLERAETNPDISNEYAYIKDFIDTSTSFFGWYTTLISVFITVGVTIFLRWGISKEVELLKSEFDTMIDSFNFKFESRVSSVLADTRREMDSLTNQVSSEIGAARFEFMTFIQKQENISRVHSEKFNEATSESALAMTNIYVIAGNNTQEKGEQLRAAGFFKRALLSSVDVTSDELGVMPIWQRKILSDIENSISIIESTKTFEPIEPMSLNEITKLINKLPESLRKIATETLMKFLKTE